MRDNLESDWLRSEGPFVRVYISIAETPILTGEDAIRFERLRKEVDNLTKEQRAENTRKLEDRIKNANIQVSICI